VTEPTRGGRNFLTLAIVGTAAAVAGGWAVGTLRENRSTPHAPDTSAVASGGTPRGALLFQAHCAACHGPDGAGDGPGAAALHPTPRDFAARPWRFPVTRESVRNVTAAGIPDTGMPAFNHAITATELDQIADHVLALATARPQARREQTEADGLLRAAGFLDKRGANLPPLILTDAAGKDVRLADLTGRLVLIHFWGTACPQCIKEFPPLAQIETDLAGKGLTVLHVCADADDITDAQALAARTTPGARTFAELSGLGLARFEVGVLPTVWLVGPDGKAVARSQGAKDWSAPAVRRMIEHFLPDPTEP